MTVWKRIIKEKRVIVSVVAVALATGIGLYGLAVYPSTIRAQQAQVRRDAARQALVTAEGSFVAARGIADDQVSATDALQRFYRDILPSDLPGARRITYPRFAALARAHNLVLERRSSVPEEDEDSRLARLRTTMLLAGDWADIRRFIHTLENAPEFVVIEEIALSQSEEVGASLVLTLGVSTYYRIEESV